MVNNTFCQFDIIDRIIPSALGVLFKTGNHIPQIQILLLPDIYIISTIGIFNVKIHATRARMGPGYVILCKDAHYKISFS